jgi:iron complex outermembrane recepter protein
MGLARGRDLGRAHFCELPRERQSGRDRRLFGQRHAAGPQHTITAQVGWKITPASRVALGLVKQGSYWMNNANTVRYAGHTLLNLTASHKLANGWEVWGQVRNLTDKLYSDNASSRYISGTYSPNTQNTYAAGAPRSVMLGLTKSFGQR